MFLCCVPVYYGGDNRKRDFNDTLFTQGLETVSMANIPQEDDRYYAAVVGVWVVSIVGQ